MMTRRSYKIDQPEPSRDDINKLMDFSDLQSRAAARSTPKTKFIWVLVGAAAVVALVWTTLKVGKSEQAQAAVQVVEFSKFNNRIPLPEEEFVIDPRAGNTLITKNGTLISIPPYAFADLSNAEEQVRLKFRDLSTTLAVFLSDIPMHYDSAGTHYHFQSAGMFQLFAEQQGRTLSLAADQRILVSYPTLNDSDGFNNYTFRENTQSWHFESPSEVGSAEEALQKHDLIEPIPTWRNMNYQYLEYYNYNRLFPPEPRLVNKENYRFYLDLDPEEFPQWAALQDVQFEVTDPRFKYHYFHTTWDDLELIQRRRGYTMVLKKGEKEERFFIYPVLEEDEFDAAYDAYLNSRDSLMIWREEAIRREREMWEAQMRKMRDAEERWKSDRGYVVLANILGDERPSKNYRTFSLPSLTTINFDNPVELPKGCSMPADFVAKNTDGSLSRLSKVLLVEIDEHAYYEYLLAEYPEFRFRKRKKNILLSADSKGRIAIASPEAFRGVKREEDAVRFTLKWVDEKIDSYDALSDFVASQTEDIEENLSD